jgi:hypothetical protein
MGSDQRVCDREVLAIVSVMVYYLEYGIDRREEARRQDLLLESAGMNRHGGEDERALHRKASNPR